MPWIGASPAVAAFDQQPVGPVHEVPGHAFANATDPAGHAISVAGCGMA
jgi:hypothetical protein